MSLTYRAIISVDWLVIHTAACRADMDIGLKEIRQLHLQRGFSDVGYHYIIRRDGTEEKGRPDTMPGAHALGYNMHSLGICLVGGTTRGRDKARIPTAEEWYANYQTNRPEPENNYTPAQFKTLEKILMELKIKYPDAEILGHRDLPGVKKACPCFTVNKWLMSLAPRGQDRPTHEEKEIEDDTGTTHPKDKTSDARREARKRRSRRDRGGRTFRV